MALPLVVSSLGSAEMPPVMIAIIDSPTPTERMQVQTTISVLLLSG